MIRALYSGVSGLSNHQKVIDVLGNNIANVNTVGFKGGRATFADIFNQTLSGATASSGSRGGTNPLQIGLGTSVNAVDTIFTQGSFQQSGRLLDLAIQGSGFFMLTDNIGGQGRTYYTRAGNFGLDSNGNMINPSNGLAVVGRMATDGVVTGTERLEAIRIDFAQTAPATVTTLMNLDGNLSSTTEPRAAGSSIALTSLFDANGNPLELRSGDVIEFNTGTIGANSVAGQEILTITDDTTLGELVDAISEVLNTNAPDQTALPRVDLRPDGTIRFTAGNDALSSITIGVRGQSNTTLEKLFTDADGDLDIDASANSIVFTKALRQADLTTTIDVFDSQGNAPTVAMAFAKDTLNVAAVTNDLAINLTDEFGNALFQVGDDFRFTAAGSIDGTNIDATNQDILTITATTTVQDILDAIEAQVDVITGGTGDATVTIDSNGNISITDNGTTGWTGVSFEKINGTTVTSLYAFSPSGSGTTTPFTILASGTGTTNSIHGADDRENSWLFQVITPHEAGLRPTGDTGRLIFETDGSLKSFTALDGSVPLPLRFDPKGTGAVQQDPTYEGVDPLSITLNFDGVIQFGGTSTAAITFQNGNPEGDLDTITIGQDGIITGIFSNGSTREIAQVLLASVPNEGGLQKVGESLFLATANSGQPVASSANTRGVGSIQSGTLELSNVDLATQFTDLVVAQRGFQANARIITTADQVLQEVVNLTR